ncbi:pollen Ole e 1 allergen/extensin family protein [Proteus mirabilis]|nr:pollen Ole e 1 allergen/extensin family protein [Proteus mirabilis]
MSNLVIVLVPFLLSLGFCYASDTLVTASEVVGSTECSGCAENDIKISHAVSGLRVTIECKVQKGHFKTRGVADLDEEGKFRVVLPDEIVKDSKLTEECFAQLHSSSMQPCSAEGDLEALKIVLSTRKDGKATFGLAKKIKFSPEFCSSDIPRIPLPKIPRGKIFPSPKYNVPKFRPRLHFPPPPPRHHL